MFLIKIGFPSAKKAVTVAIFCTLVFSPLAFSDNSPYWTQNPPEEVWVEELRQITFDMEATDENPMDSLTLSCVKADKYSHGWIQNTSPANPVYGEFEFISDSCDDYENGPDYTLMFTVADNHAAPQALACTAYTVVHILTNDPPEITEVTDVPECFSEEQTFCIDVTVHDPDDYPYDLEGSPGEIRITYELAFPDPLPGPYNVDFVDNGDGSASLCFTPGAYFVPPPDSIVDYDGYEYLFDVIFTATDKCNQTDICTLEVDVSRSFLIHPRKVLAYVGQQHVKVPIFLWNCAHGVAGWDILIEYDNTAGDVIGVELCDSIYLEDPAGPGWCYAPWALYPDIRLSYFTYELNPTQRGSYVRVVGLLNLPGSPDTLTTIPPSENWLFFCLIYDVDWLWDGHNVVFGFHTDRCPDNTFADSTGYIVWGPDTVSASNWICPQRPDSLKKISLMGGYGIGLRTVSVGDLNCNGMSFEIGDAVVFIEYLIIGEEALCQGDCKDLPDCLEYQTQASDVNEDGVYWNVSDLVRLLNLINGVLQVERVLIPAPVSVELSSTVDGVAVSTISNSPFGAALFVFEYPPNLEIETPRITGRLNEMDVVSSIRNGKLRVLVYSLESHHVTSGNTPLFTIPVKGIAAGEEENMLIKLVDVSFSDPYGRSLPIGDLVVPDDEPCSSRDVVLERNYPNPLTNHTTIAFVLPADSHVTLNVYNLAGQLIQTLVNESMGAGRHKVIWDARDVPAGLYFHKLQVGSHCAVRRAVVLR